MMTRRIINFISVLTIILIMLSNIVLTTEPEPSPTIEDAIQFDYVVVAEYLRRIDRAIPTYVGGTTVKYKVLDILKGDAIDEYIELHYSFHGNYIYPNEGTDWIFSDSTMPEINSRWILFISKDDKVDDIFVSYRGVYGRHPLNEVRFEAAREAIVQMYGGLSNASIVPGDDYPPFNDLVERDSLKFFIICCAICLVIIRIGKYIKIVSSKEINN